MSQHVAVFFESAEAFRVTGAASEDLWGAVVVTCCDDVSIFCAYSCLGSLLFGSYCEFLLWKLKIGRLQRAFARKALALDF